VANSGVSAQIGIVHRSVTETAPEAVVFDLSLAGFDTPSANPGQVYNPQLHDLYYYWDFGDSYKFQAPENLISQYLNSGIAFGPMVSHTYRGAGRYNVTCLIVEPSSGKTALASREITIGDQSIYDGSGTVFVGTTGAPAGAKVVRTLDAAFETVFSGDQDVPRRIMIERGLTLKPSSLRRMGAYSAPPSVLICAGPGNGAKPKIDTVNDAPYWQNVSGSRTDVDLKIQDIEFVGPWDVTTQTGSQQNCLFLQQNQPLQLLIDGCAFVGYNLSVYPSNTTYLGDDPFVILNDTVITDYRAGGYLGDSNTAVTGCQIAQNPEALSGYAGASNNLISGLRFGRSPIVICTQNDMFSRTGWWTANIPGIYDNQPCFRGNTSGVRGAFLNINCNSMEGGYSALAIDLNDSDKSRAINAIVEKNLLVGYHDSITIFEFGFGGITARNNIGIIPNAPRYGLPLRHFAMGKRRGSDAENAAAPINLYNNTFVCLTDTRNVSGGAISIAGIDAGYTNVTVSNNVSHQPNRGGAVARLDTTVLWSPRYTHYEDDNTPRDISKATPQNTIALYSPQIGSDVLGGALNGTVAYDDFFGRERPYYPSLGALETL
jgi:hypothetical protein